MANSGSASLSLDGDVRAAYAVVEDGKVDIRRVSYDIDRVAADLIRIDYPNAEAYANWLRTGAWTPPG